MTEADAREEMTRLLAAERMPMVHLATLLVGSVAVAEEVVQDAFLSASERWNEIGRPGEYLRTAVAGRSVSELRRRSVEGRSRSPAGQESAHRIPEQLVELHGALARLSDRHRAVVVLRYLADLPDAQIAETLGVRPAAVRSLIHRALAALSQDVATGGLEERLRQQLPALAAEIVQSHAADAGQETASIWPRQPRKRRRPIQLAVLAVLLAAAALIAGSVLVDQPAERATTSSPPSTLPAATVPATTTLSGTESEAASEPPSSETPAPQPPTTEPPTAEPPATTSPEPDPEPPATTPPEPDPEPEPEPPTTAVTPELIDDDPCLSSETVDQALEALVADCYALWIFSLFQDAEEQFNSDPDTAWVAGNPLQNWLGVTVSGGRVTELHLDGLNLYVLEPSLGYLDSLERLVLSNNELSGPIPADFGNLTRLQHLDLSNNQLTGELPPELSNLTNLTHLDLSNNQLTGELPPELGNLTRLQHLDLSNNRLRGPLPSELANVKNLNFTPYAPPEPVEGRPCTFPEVVDQTTEALVADCEALWSFFTGDGWRGNVNLDPDTAPASLLLDLYALTWRGNINLDPDTAWEAPNPIQNWNGVTITGGRVTALHLEGLNLSGPLVQSLASLDKLERLDLSRNQFAGPIPAELANLTNLKHLDLGGNELSGPIPAELANLTDLEHLDLLGNQFTGPIPAELANLTKLTNLNLGRNQLSGPIPAELANLTKLTNLNLGRNQLSGPIPAQLGNLTKLTSLNLSDNQLSGPIPAQLGNLTNLTSLNLGLTDLWLGRNNQLSGLIPGELGNLTNLERLDLSHNHLTGPIPAQLGNLTKLTSLDLGDNDLSEQIPPELDNLTNLKYLDLSHNRLSGPLSPALTNVESLEYSPHLSSPCALPTVVDQALEALVADCEGLWSFFENQGFWNPIGEDTSSRWGSANPLEAWEWVVVRDGRVTELRIPVFPSSEVALTADLGNLTALEHLSGCYVHGQLPPEIGNLTNLKTIEFYSYSIGPFNACANFLTGPIPPEFGNLANLEILNISDNDLTGPIPPELGNLINLKELRLDNNSRGYDAKTGQAGLSGPIPPELGNLTNLTELELSCNSLTGPIPAELGNLTNLTVLGLGYNDLSGPVPPALRDLVNLERLVLYDNEQLGPTPDELLHVAEDFSYFEGIVASSRQEVLMFGWEYYRYRYWRCPTD